MAVHLLIALHITHWLVAGRTVTPVEPSEAMAFSKGSMVNAGLLFFAAAILVTAVFGRYFCGWACHLVALQDLCRWLLARIGIRPRPLRSRVLALVPYLAFIYMFLWPVAYRLWIGDHFGPLGAELTTTEFWATFPGWVIGTLTFLICGFAVVYLLGAKGFCTYACPYGAIFALADRVAPFRIRVTEDCSGCGHCTAVCTSNVRVHEEVRDWGMVVDSGCMKCRDCVSVCPSDALYYGFGSIPLASRPRAAAPPRSRRPLVWWEEVVLGVGFAAAFFTFRGLYGAVPFLMSLGLAGVLAWGTLMAARLVVRPHVAALRLRLKRDGRLQPPGFAFLAAMAVVGLLWGHSALVRYHAYVGERVYRQTADLRRGADLLEVRREPLGLASARRITRALAHLERVRDIGLFETSGNAARLAWLYFLEGSSRQLDTHARRALERGEEVTAMHRLLAAVAASRGDLAAAVSAYEQAIESDPSQEGLYAELGILLARSGAPAAAETIFGRGLERFPKSALLVYNAGLIRALQGDTAGAIARFERAVELDPRLLEARENLAGMLASVGRFAESATRYRQVIQERPEDPETRILLATVLIEMGDLEAAREQAREALRLDPDRREVRALLEELDTRRGEGKRTEGRR